jgi:hypothetical protein
MHDDPDVQLTPNRAAPATPAGLEVAWMLHRVPFHRSARVVELGTFGLAAPTAVHADADVQDTPKRAPPTAGLGIGWMRQEWPSHRSARDTWARVLLVVPPTAMHADGAMQVTALKLLDAAPGGLTAASTVQAEPFHPSATAAGVWAVGVYPTAVQAVPEAHATPISTLDPVGLGVAWRCQAVPFHRAARVRKAPELVW